MHIKWGTFCVLLVVSIGFNGCGSGNELGRMPVTGEVTFGGEPLDHGSIEFTPTGEGTQSGSVIENGKYEIAESRGLPPGEYIVRIYSPEGEGANPTGEPPAPGESSDLPEERIPPSFNVKSDQKVTVKSGEENKFDFAIPKSK